MKDHHGPHPLRRRKLLGTASAANALLTVAVLVGIGLHKDLPTDYLTISATLFGAVAGQVLLAHRLLAPSRRTPERVFAGSALSALVAARLVVPIMIAAFIAGYWLPETIPGAIMLWAALLVSLCLFLRVGLSRSRLGGFDRCAVASFAISAIAELATFMVWASGA